MCVGTASLRRWARNMTIVLDLSDGGCSERLYSKASSPASLGILLARDIGVKDRISNSSSPLENFYSSLKAACVEYPMKTQIPRIKPIRAA